MSTGPFVNFYNSNPAITGSPEMMIPNPFALPAKKKTLGGYASAPGVTGSPEMMVPYPWPPPAKAKGDRYLAGLGDVIPQSSIIGFSPSAFGTGILQSPFLYAGIGLLALYLWSGAQGKPRKRRLKVSPFNSALLLTGAVAGGYLAGKYL